MAISQTQIVDYLNKKLGYGVAKTDVSTAKSPSNEANASPLLNTGNTIWQLSHLIPATIPAASSSIVTVYADSLSTTVQCTVDNTTSVPNSTWSTNLIDWIPPQFGSTYQVKVYAAAPGTVNPQSTGTQLFVDGSGNNDGWFFDYQAGILNFADTNIPSAVSGKVIYIVGARYTGQKGITNFPLGINLGNVSVSGNATIGNIITTSGLFWANGVSAIGTYSNSNVISYLSGPVSVGNLSTASGIFWPNGVNYSSTVQGLFGNSNIASYLSVDPTITNINSNISTLFANAATQAVALNGLSTSLTNNVNAVTVLFANAASQQLSINSLATSANANTAAFLASGTITDISLSGNSTVAGNATVGGNLTVTGNLIVVGNSYVLQTEILACNEVISNSIYAQAYFYGNGTPLNYGNVQVAAFLPGYTGSLANSADIVSINATNVQQSNQITAANNRIQIIDANLGVATTNISTLFANATTQTVRINTINANLGVATNDILTLYANTVGQQNEIAGLRANIIAANATINSSANTINSINANIGSLTNTVNSISANLGAYQNTTNANLGLATVNISNLQNNLLAYQIFANANLVSLNTGLNSLQANVGAYQIQVNSNVGTISVNLNSLLANVGAYQIATNANLGAYQIFANANAAAQQVSINSLATNANANTAAYLLRNTVIIGGSAEATVANTGVLQVYGGASIGSNLFVAGNLIVAGNSYVLQTEILSQNEVITNSIYAAGYFYSNGVPLVSNSFGNGNVAAYLATYTGNLRAGNIVCLGDFVTANIKTAGTYGNINNVNTIFANNYVFSGNGVNIITTILNAGYSNVNLQAYLNGTISVGNILTTNGLFWANGVNALVPAYGNTQVAAYLPTYAGTLGANILNATSAVIGTATIGTANATNINTVSNITAANISATVITATANVSTGNIIAGQFLWANGVVFSSSNYGNANVASYLATYTGNISANHVIVSNTVFGRTFIGNVSSVGNVIAGNIITTGNGGNITGANVISANTFVFGANGINILSAIPPSYTNSNVQAFLANFGSNTITTTGNITAGNFSGGQLNATGNVISNNIITNSLFYPNGAPYQFGSTYSNANVQSYLASFGSNNITTTGNISTGNLSVGRDASIAGNLTVVGQINVSNITVTNTEIVTVTETLLGNSFVLGNTVTGNLLTDSLRYANGTPYSFTSFGNAQLAAFLPIYGGNILANFVTVTSNITAANATIQNLRTPGSYGNISGANVIAANTFVFNGNGVNILNAFDSRVGAYLTTYTGNLSAGNVFTNTILYANGLPYIFGSTYGNANVASYLPTDVTIIGIQANLGAYQIFANANASVQAIALNTINANLGAYQSWANANFGTLTTSITTLQANVGSYQIVTNANLGTATININSLNANVGAYQIFATANAATQSTGINNTNANLGAYQSWANSTFGTSSYTNLDLQANLTNGVNRIVVVNSENATAANTGAFRVWGGASISANLFVAGNLIVAGNSYVLQTEILASNEVVSNAIYALQYFYANGVPLNYGNVQVAAYLATNTDPVISNLNGNAAVQAVALDNINANLGAYQTFANANAASQATSINVINANLGGFQAFANATYSIGSTTNDLVSNIGAYQIYANANLGTATNNIIALQANLGAYQIYANANLGTATNNINTIFANLGTATLNINSINANLGAYQIFANANASSQATSINVINANVGAYQIYANANLGTATNNIIALQANLGAYQIFANANAATQAVSINSIDANVGAYQVWSNANATAQALSINSLATNANANTAAYLPFYFGNIGANLSSSAGPISIMAGSSSWKFNLDGSLYAPSGALFDNTVTINTGSYAGEHTELYLGGDTGWAAGESHGIEWFYGSKTTPSTLARLDAYYNGTKGTFRWKNLYYAGQTTSTVMSLTATGSSTADLEVKGNAQASILLTDNIRYSNGAPYIFGSTYSESNVAAFLSTYTGNIAAGNVEVTGNVYTDYVTTKTGSISLVPATTGLVLLQANTAVKLPTGTTVDRPAGYAGYLRFNTDFGSIEYYDGSKWQLAVNSINEQLLTGDGVTTTFTLDQVTTAIGILVSINGTVQTPNSAYTVSGTQIVFAEAPLATDYVDIRYLTSASASITDLMIVAPGNVAVGTGISTIDAWSTNKYRSAKYTISSSTGSESQLTEILLTHDGSAAFISNTTLKTGANRVDFTATLVGGNVQLKANSTTTGNQLKIQRTYFEA